MVFCDRRVLNLLQKYLFSSKNMIFISNHAEDVSSGNALLERAADTLVE